jgi:hypothetical protein
MQHAEDNIWTSEVGNNRRLEKSELLGVPYL